MGNKIYSEDINECHERIKKLQKEKNELTEKLKVENSNKIYYKDLYNQQLSQNNILKNRIDKIKKLIDKGYSQSENFNAEHSGVYRVYNKLTGESYVGQSSVDVYKRCISHFAEADYPEGNWHNDVIEHPEQYDYEILVEGVKNQSDLDRLEVYYMGKYDAIEHGYNRICSGKCKFVATYGIVDATPKIEQLE